MACLYKHRDTYSHSSLPISTHIIRNMCDLHRPYNAFLQNSYKHYTLIQNGHWPIRLSLFAREWNDEIYLYTAMMCSIGSSVSKQTKWLCFPPFAKLTFDEFMRTNRRYIAIFFFLDVDQWMVWLQYWGFEMFQTLPVC